MTPDLIERLRRAGSDSRLSAEKAAVAFCDLGIALRQIDTRLLEKSRRRSLKAIARIQALMRPFDKTTR
jgi:hypothetical protein